MHVFVLRSLLDQGEEATCVAKTLGIKSNTLNKAILDGRLHKAFKKNQPSSQQTASSKSKRNAIIRSLGCRLCMPASAHFCM